MALLVTGSIGIDDVTTPHGTAEGVLGGSAVYAAFAAVPYGPVRLVAVVGEDFPEVHLTLMRDRGIDHSGLEVRRGSRTFRWKGEYAGDMSTAQTLDVRLNVLAEHGPKVPGAYADSEVVFLANTHPTLQRQMLAQVRQPRLSVCDMNNLWIERERDSLLETLKRVDGAILNDAEVRQLTGKVNLIEAAESLLAMGPRFAVIKKGEHGALMLTGSGPTTVPAYPTKRVCDPTGAGDSFAGGMFGYVASTGRYDDEELRRGLLRGTVAASFVIEGFSLNGVLRVGREEIDRRIDDMRRMMRIE